MKDSVNKYLVFNAKGEHEYNIHVETTKKGEKFTLYYSEIESWVSTTRGEKIMSMINTGNGVILDRKIKVLNYHELAELRLLLRFENKINGEVNWDDYKIIPINKTIKIK